MDCQRDGFKSSGFATLGTSLNISVGHLSVETSWVSRQTELARMVGSATKTPGFVEG